MCKIGNAIEYKRKQKLAYTYNVCGKLMKHVFFFLFPNDYYLSLLGLRHVYDHKIIHM